MFKHMAYKRYITVVVRIDLVIIVGIRGRVGWGGGGGGARMNGK